MKKRYPHFKVLTRLGVSKIHGIGVFALFDIEKGQRVFYAGDSTIVWVKGSVVNSLPPQLRKFYKDFAIRKKNLYGCPRNFGHIPISWYCNHSEKPNLQLDSDYHATAVMRIKKGTELTLDYATF